MEPRELKKEKYSVQINYSPEATEKKLLKFIPVDNQSFEISAEELSTMLIGGVNSSTIEATFVDSQRINVVEVSRQLQCELTEDMKKGTKININYVHPYPLDFAIIEQSYGIAKINMDVPAVTLTPAYIEGAIKKIKPEQEKFLNTFYKSFKNIKLNSKNKLA
jgi:hypothetical protein